MQFVKINNRYVNMAQVHEVEINDTVGIDTIYLYTSEHTIRIVEKDEQAAVLAWLNRNSINVLKQRDL